MSDPAKPLWSAASAFPFMPFPIPGFAPASPPVAAPASALTGGFDMLKSLWGGVPGASQVPAFLLPTVDLDELDKRISDLRAAENWVEVNLNMLRSTIQALEVQRHTIAALHSLSAVGDPKPAAAAPPPPVAPPPPLAAPEPAAPEQPPPVPEPVASGSAASPTMAAPWLDYLQNQFARVATAALATTPAKPVAKEPRPAARKAKPARKRASRASQTR